MATCGRVHQFQGFDVRRQDPLTQPRSLEIRASKYISATPLLHTLLHDPRQFQSETSSEWC